MSVSAVKGLLWTAIAIAFAMISATLSPAFDRTESFALFAGGCLVAIIAALWYRRAISTAEAREDEARAEQLIALKQRLSLTGEPLPIRASTNVLIVVLMVALSIWFALAAFRSPSAGSISIFAIVLILTLALALSSLPLVGKPALTIKRDGLETPIHGFFPWEEIESIGVQRYQTKGVTTHSIHLYVPRLKDREDRMHALLKLRRFVVRGSRPNFVVIPLVFPSLPGSLVHTLCYELWRERTGRTKTWTAVLGDKDIEQLRRGEEQLEALNRIGTMAEKDPLEAMKLLDELKTKFPPEEPRPKRNVSARDKARVEALTAALRTIDPGDEAARRRVMDKLIKEEVRRSTTLGFVLIVVGFAVVMGLVVLLG
jgi:hypothetical protein